MSVSSSVALSGRGKRKSKAIQDAEAVQAYELRIAGRHTAEIAETLGVSVTTVKKRLADARALVVMPVLEAHRELNLARLDKVILGLLTDAERHGGSLSPRHAEVFIQAVKEQNSLAGLAKPVTQHLEVAMTITGSIDSELDALAAELGMNDPAAATAPPADQSLGANP